MKKLASATLAGLAAIALSLAATTPASAATVYTGGKSCPSYSYAFTRAAVMPGSTIRHYQLINGYWFGSSPQYNGNSYNVNTNFIVSTSVKSFSNSYVTASPNAPQGAAALCA